MITWFPPVTALVVRRWREIAFTTIFALYASLQMEKAVFPRRRVGCPIPSCLVMLLVLTMDLVHLGTGMHATNGATCQGCSDHSSHLTEAADKKLQRMNVNIPPLGGYI